MEHQHLVAVLLNHHCDPACVARTIDEAPEDEDEEEDEEDEEEDEEDEQEGEAGRR